jgi:CelD/BcsL family acetyltransferase involved in cellulose biosynthesis
MNIRTSKFECLTQEEIAAWSRIQSTEPLLASPYFRPEFTQAVSAVRNDVEVAVLSDGIRPVGFLPFQRSWRNVGHPVGDLLSDFHGLIASSTVECEPVELLRACQLTAWHFDHLISCSQTFSPFIRNVVDAPYIDLSDGMDSYVARRKNGRRIMAEYRRDCGKLTRDIGPIRYEPHSRDRVVLSTLFAWKSEHLRLMGATNSLDYSWVRDLLDKILEDESPDFAPILSVVYAGDTIVAIQLSMRSRTVVHWWFTSYNFDLARYSPGVLNMIEDMKAAALLGIHRVDFGPGPEQYKYRLMSGAIQVAEGTADVRRSAAIIRRAWCSAKNRIRSSSLAAPARALSRKVRSARHFVDARIANQKRHT